MTRRIGLYLLALGLASCSDSPPVTTSVTVGPSGGAVALGGATLTVPPGALAATTQITVETGGTPPGGTTALSPLFTFGPDGTQFGQPVTLAIVLASPGIDPVVYWSNAVGGYDELPTTVSGTTVTAAVTHFSHGFIGERHHHGDAGVADASVADGGSGVDAGASGDASPGPDARTDAGGGVMGVTVLVDGVSTLFASNMTVSVVSGVTTVDATTSVSTPYARIRISVNTVMQEVCGANGTSITYYEPSGGSYGGGSCTLVVAASPTTPGDHSTGSIFAATLNKLNAPTGSPPTHTLGTGSWDFVY